MAEKHAKKVLAKNGFDFIRDTRKGEIWGDGVSTIMVGRDLHGRRYKNFEADIKRAIKKRPPDPQ